jgi:GNAT superfamily N-acetyltransferase
VVDVRIRSAVAADGDALSGVYRRSSLSNEGDRTNLLAHPDTLVFSSLPIAEDRVRVAVLDDRIVGFATVLIADRTGELEGLFVDPDWMQLGIGRALVTDAVANARRRGVTRIDVTANDHALEFYEKVGFVLDGVTKTRFGPAPRLHLDVR